MAPLTGSGTTNTVPKFTSASNLGDSIIKEISGKVGVGTATPAVTLDVNGIIQLTGFKMPTGAINNYVLTSDAAGLGTWKALNAVIGGGTANALPKFTGANGIGDSAINESAGNIGIGTATPGAKLDVNGNVSTSGSVQALRSILALNGLIGKSTNPSTPAGLFDGATNGKIISGQVGGSEKFSVDGSGKVVANGVIESTFGGFKFPDGSVQSSAASGSGGSLISESGGNVGIGTSTPGSTLEVNGTVQLGGNAAAPGLHVDLAGRVGIGTTTPGVPLEVNGYIQSAALKVQAGSATGDPYIVMGRKYGGSEVETKTIAVRGPTGGTWLALGDYATPDVLTISNGFVGMGTTNPQEKLHVVGHIICSGNISCSMELISSRGYCTGSSKRWKKNIEPLTDALNIVQRLQGVAFDWKEDGRRDIGFIAEDVGKAVPEVVRYEENGEDAKGIDYGRLTAILVEAVKEQQNQIDELRAIVKSLLAEKQMVAVSTS